MRDLKTFQEKIEAYRKNAPTPHTQKDLAAAIPLDKDELSKRLNAYKHPDKASSPLTCAQVQAVVRALARWGAIETQEQAKDLLDLMECPHFSISDWKTSPLNLLRSAPVSSIFSFGKPVSIDIQRNEEKLARLRAMLIDHSSFLRPRLESFVGRETELRTIHQLINALLPMGGYITITGQAGQGKSSIIAQLVDEYGPEKIAHHFIPFNPGPGYQVNLLRDLMARLILKYDLSDLYVASESRPALRDFFPKVLMEVVVRGKQEVILIDGLDQLMEEPYGGRDLSFLPNNPPEGIVFVLGTRPNDTLNPLELRKPHMKYELPNLSRHDFNLILEHRRVKLDTQQADQLYQLMQENALYLDLVAKELTHEEEIRPEDIINRVADDPENLFSLSMERLQKSPNDLEWHALLKPALGILLVSREPLSRLHIRYILHTAGVQGIDDHRLRKGLERLGGLIAKDGQQRYSLFHLKLSEYLRQDESKPHKEYIFALDEERNWHKVLADWCELHTISVIWDDVRYDSSEQSRRVYARHHYITHLSHAMEWSRLFTVLDEGTYGLEKVRYDPSARLYVQDLDLGRKASAWKGWTLNESLDRLTYLWRYTLLRCSLTSQAAGYPLEAFDLLLLLNRESEAVGLVELLPKPSYKIKAMLRIAKWLALQPGRERESTQLFLRVSNLVSAVEESSNRTEALSELGTALVEVQQLEWAEAVIRTIEDDSRRASALIQLGSMLAKAQQLEHAKLIWSEAEMTARMIRRTGQGSDILQELVIVVAQAQMWEWAEAIVRSLEFTHNRVSALSKLGSILVQSQQWERAEEIWTQAEEIARVNSEIGFWRLVSWKTPAVHELIVALVQAQQWERAEAVVDAIRRTEEKLEALCELGVALTFAQQRERAEAIWTLAEALVHTTERSWRNPALQQLFIALTRVRQWERVEALWIEVDEAVRTSERSDEETSDERNKVLSEMTEVLAEIKEWERAEKAAGAIEKSWRKDWALQKLGSALAEAREWERAEAIIGTIQDSNYSNLRDEALQDMTVALAEAREWERAEATWAKTETTASSSRMGKRIVALCKWGIALIRAQQWKGAETKWAEIRTATLTNQWYDTEDIRSSILRDVGKALLRAQQWDRAEAVAQTIEKSKVRAGVLEALVSALIQSHCLDRAEAVAHVIEESFERVWALSELGAAFAQYQQWEHAQSLWDEAETVARTAEAPDRSPALRKLESSLAQAQQWDRAEAVARSIEDGMIRTWALSELGTAFAQCQQWGHAQSLWDEAEAIAGTVVGDEERAFAFGKHGIELAQAQQWERAEASIRSIESSWRLSALRDLISILIQAQRWEQVEIIANTFENDFKVDVLSQLGMAFALRHQLDRAKSLGYKAEGIIHTIAESRILVEQLSKLGALFAIAQEWDHGKILWEEAEAIAQTSEVFYMMPRALTEQTKALARLGKYEQLMHLVQRFWLQVETREEAINFLSIATEFIALRPEMGTAFCEAFNWVGTFMRGRKASV